MTAAVYRAGTPAYNVPQTQNTAPVLEFNCLYTHDVRRKQKRWQDGFLRFHTFNKRVMVYDVPRNFIGDTHWTEDVAIQDGDEVTLEKGGVMVQVAEAVGRSETDLTELRKSAKKGSSERGSSPIGRPPQTPGSRAATGRPTTQSKHRSLNAMLGNPRGPIGKAILPSKSPFQLRHSEVENEEWEGGRAPKRSRTEGPAAWNVTRTTTTVKPAGRQETPLLARTVDARKQKVKAPLQPGQQRLKTSEVIDLRDDVPEQERFLPGFSSDALAPLSSPQRQQAVKTMPPPVRSSSPAFQTQKAPKERSRAISPPRTHAQTRQETRSHAATGGSHIKGQTRSNLRAVQPADSALGNSRHEESEPRDVETRRYQRDGRSVSDKGSTLRIATAPSKKKTLLCQDQLLNSKPKRIHSFSTEADAERLLSTAFDNEDAEGQQHSKTEGQKLQERLARIKRKEAKAKAKQPNVDAEVPFPVAIEPEPLIRNSVTATADAIRNFTALELAELDRMILPPKQNTLAQATEALIPTLADCPAVETTRKASSREKKGVGKREIRASGKSCFPTATKPEDGPIGVASEQQHVEQQPPEQPSREMPQVEPRSAPQQAKTSAEPEHRPSPPPPPSEDRQLRRVVSDSTTLSSSKPKRIPGAPMRYTPSPSKRNLPPNPLPPTTKQPAAEQRPKAKAPFSKRPLQRAVSLNTAATGTAAVMLGRQFQPPKPATEVEPAVVSDTHPAVADPWSREAFDLFDWRPPGWDEERWCFKHGEGMPER